MGAKSDIVASSRLEHGGKHHEALHLVQMKLNTNAQSIVEYAGARHPTKPRLQSGANAGAAALTVGFL